MKRRQVVQGSLAGLTTGFLVGTAAAPASAETNPPGEAVSAPVEGSSGARRNFYHPSRFGQLHVHGAQPGASESFPPLFCLHQGPQSGRVFEALLPRLGRDRQVYAPDYPGCGASSPAPEPYELETLASIIEDLILALDPPMFDFLGYHTGSCIATELALRHPTRVRRLVLVGVPVLDEDFNIERLYQTGDGQPIPAPLQADGSHLLVEWRRSEHWFRGASTQVIQRTVIDKLLAGEHQTWASRAALLYPLRDRLPRVRQPVLAVGPRDDLWDYSPRSEALLRNGRYVSWPEQGFGLFDIATEAVERLIRQHLDTDRGLGPGVRDPAR